MTNLTQVLVTCLTISHGFIPKTEISGFIIGRCVSLLETAIQYIKNFVPHQQYSLKFWMLYIFANTWYYQSFKFKPFWSMYSDISL